MSFWDVFDYIQKNLMANPKLGVLLAILAQVFPVTAVQVYAVGALIAVDTITGIMAAKARGEEIRSTVARKKTSSKIMGHLILVLSAAATVPLLGSNVVLMGIFGLISSWECLSILENSSDLGFIDKELLERSSLVKFLQAVGSKQIAQTIAESAPVKKEEDQAP